MTPAEIARSLSEAQRKALVDCDWHGSGETYFATIPVQHRSCLSPELAYMFTLHSDRITPLGLAVRAAILGD